MSKTFVTPLRYPGGKGRLGAWLAEVIKLNRLQNGTYIEPYAGGAGAAVFLLSNNYIDRIVINDADPVIYAFWKAVLHDTERLINLIQNTPVTMETWHTQRSIVDSGDTADLTALGFATFFLNRTNRSGIIKGGVIGGKDQTGPYKIDARYKTEDLILRMRRLETLKDRISLFNLDAMDLLEARDVGRNNNSLTYLDPPYYQKGSQLYRNHYKPEDHKHIAEKVQAMDTPWLVTYDNCEPIRNLYQESNCVEFSLQYSTHILRPKATEVMFSGGLTLFTDPYIKR